MIINVVTFIGGPVDGYELAVNRIPRDGEKHTCKTGHVYTYNRKTNTFNFTNDKQKHFKRDN